MAFNHYAKIKRILNEQPQGWYIKRIDEPARALSFKGETISYPHYYRIYDANGQAIKYCKFQKLDLLARSLRVEPEDLPVVN